MVEKSYDVEIRGVSRRFKSGLSARKYAAEYFSDHPRSNISIPIWGADETVKIAKTLDARPKKVLVCVVSKKSGVKVYKLNKNGTLGDEIKEKMRYIWW